MNWPASASRLASAFLFSTGLLLTTSCEKPGDLGVELPGTTRISADYQDFPVTASTVLIDSLETNKAEQYLVGRLRDNDLNSTTTARAFFNLRVAAASDSLPAKYTSPLLDSLVMVLPFNQVSGSTQPVRFDISNLPQPLDERGTYNSSTNVPLGAAIATNLAGSLNRTVSQKQRVSKGVTGDTTTTVVTTQVADRSVRLALYRRTQPSAFGTALFDAMKDASFAQAQLQAIWKGIAVAPAADFAGTMVAFGRFGNRVNVYFHDAANKRHVYAFYFGSPSNPNNGAAGYNLEPLSVPDAPRYFTQITTDLSASGALARLTDGNQAVPASETNGLTYMQDGVGLATKLVIPALEELRTKPGIAINRAELLIPVKPYTNLLFPNPGSAFLYEINQNNRVLLRTVGTSLTERLVQSDSTANVLGQGVPARARYYPLNSDNIYYSALITNYVHAYVSGQLDGRPAALLLSPTLRSSLRLTLNRAILNGNDIRFRVYYSKLR